MRPWRFELTAGVRAAYLRYGDVSTWALDPRGVVRYKLTERVKLKLASGLFSQPPLPFQVTRGTGNPNLAPNRALAELGRHRRSRCPRSSRSTATLFYSHMWQLTRPTGRASVDEQGNAVRPFFDDDGKGRAYGFELLVRGASSEGLFGWLSYTLSRSERFLEGGRDGAVRVRPDPRGQPGAQLCLRAAGPSARASRLATGRPVDDLLDPDGDARRSTTPTRTTSTRTRGGRRIRLPTYHQLDVRIDRAFTSGPVEGSVFLDVINVYNAQNSEGYQYSYDFTRARALPGLAVPADDRREGGAAMRRRGSSSLRSRAAALRARARASSCRTSPTRA